MTTGKLTLEKKKMSNMRRMGLMLGMVVASIGAFALFTESGNELYASARRSLRMNYLQTMFNNLRGSVSPFAVQSIQGEREKLLSKPQLQFCCMAMTPQCLACAAGISVEDWLERNTLSFEKEKRRAGPFGQFMLAKEAPRRCCMAMIPQCLACHNGMSLEEWQNVYESQFGQMEKRRAGPFGQFQLAKESPQMCCMAMTPQCLACQAGISIQEWRNQNTPNAVSVPTDASFREKGWFNNGARTFFTNPALKRECDYGIAGTYWSLYPRSMCP